jgi:hypothetical protein
VAGVGPGVKLERLFCSWNILERKESASGVLPHEVIASVC